MSRTLFAARADKHNFGDELITSLSRVLKRPHDEVSKLMSGQYSTFNESSNDPTWGVLVDLLSNAHWINIYPMGEPGWTTMLQFCCDYAMSNDAPMVMYDSDYNFCVNVDVGSTKESVEKLIDEDPFCGAETFK